MLDLRMPRLLMTYKQSECIFRLLFHAWKQLHLVAASRHAVSVPTIWPHRFRSALTDISVGPCSSPAVDVYGFIPRRQRRRPSILLYCRRRSLQAASFRSTAGLPASRAASRAASRMAYSCFRARPPAHDAVVDALRRPTTLNRIVSRSQV